MVKSLSESTSKVGHRHGQGVHVRGAVLRIGFYAIGTALTNRLGFPKHIQFPFKGDPPMAFRDKRGMCKLVRCAEFPDIHAAAWLDRKPVYFLATGVSTCKSSVQRKLKDGAATEVSCPEFIADYSTYMGGVDTHDQLRLQRYSVQRSVRYAKYYKMLFLGVNSSTKVPPTDLQYSRWRMYEFTYAMSKRSRTSIL